MILDEDILYEDNHIIVVNKKSGVLSQSNGSDIPDMLSIIKCYLKKKYNKPGNVYLGLVHRLDKSVSGVMVYAKTSKAASRLSEQIRNHTFKKEYVCITDGKFTKNKCTLTDYIHKDEFNKKSYITTKAKGKVSVLDYDVISYNKNKNCSLVHVTLHTGRFHQIRLQLSNIGNPIIGDIKYGNRPYKNRILLHAYKITFNHPTKNQKISFTKTFDENILDEFNFQIN